MHLKQPHGTLVNDAITGDISEARKRHVESLHPPGYNSPVFQAYYDDLLYLVDTDGENLLYCGDATPDNTTRVKTYEATQFIAVNVPDEALICSTFASPVPKQPACRDTNDDRAFNTDLWYVIDRETGLGVHFTTPPETITTFNNGQWALLKSPNKQCAWKAGTDETEHNTYITQFKDTQLPPPNEDELTDITPVGERVNELEGKDVFPGETPTVDMRVKHTDKTFECFIEDVMRAEPHLNTFKETVAFVNGELKSNPPQDDLRNQHHCDGLDSPAAQRIIDEHGYDRRNLSLTDKIRILNHVAAEPDHRTVTDNSLDARTEHQAQELHSKTNS